jgi:drug/metabolite transporter (DMT)-like permease
MLVLLCLLWGINWPVMKIALQEIPPLSMRTISSAFGALTLLGICAVSRRRFRIASAKAWGHLCVISLLNIGFFSILSAYAQITAATTRVAILAYTMPIWAVLLAWAAPFYSESPSRSMETEVLALLRPRRRPQSQATDKLPSVHLPVHRSHLYPN